MPGTAGARLVSHSLHSVTAASTLRCRSSRPLPTAGLHHRAPLRAAASLKRTAAGPPTAACRSLHRARPSGPPPLPPSPRVSILTPLMGPGAAPSLLCSSLPVCLRPGSPERSQHSANTRAVSERGGETGRPPASRKASAVDAGVSRAPHPMSLSPSLCLIPRWGGWTRASSAQ